MIKSLRFKNFYSFSEETEVSFQVGKQPRQSAYDVHVGEERYNKIIAVLGPNGSGKTAILKPFVFLTWFLTGSFKRDPDDQVPFEPHALHKDDETSFELFFSINESSYRYELVLTKEHVIHEALYVKTSSAYSYVFTRDREGEAYTYKHKGFDIKPSEAARVQDNASLISAGTFFGGGISTSISQYFKTNMSNITQFGRRNFNDRELIDSAEFFFKNDDVGEQMKSIISKMDLGLADIEVEPFDGKDSDGKDVTLYMPMGVHKVDDELFVLPFFEESSGTKSSYTLLRWLLPVLNDGGIAVIDELDNDLHPHMLPFILDLFKHHSTNPKDAQLIFSCHTAEVMNSLMKHQIYLTEKKDLVSTAWRLDDIVGLRADDNIYAKYYAGALGGTPDV